MACGILVILLPFDIRLLFLNSLILYAIFLLKNSLHVIPLGLCIFLERRRCFFERDRFLNLLLLAISLIIN